MIHVCVDVSGSGDEDKLLSAMKSILSKLRWPSDNVKAWAFSTMAKELVTIEEVQFGGGTDYGAPVRAAISKYGLSNRHAFVFIGDHESVAFSHDFKTRPTALCGVRVSSKYGNCVEKTAELLKVPHLQSKNPDEILQFIAMAEVQES